MNKRACALLIVIALSIPLALSRTAYADSASASNAVAPTSWVSMFFGWHAPLTSFTGYFSSLFESRQYNLENNNMQRDQLVNERRTMLPSDMASTSPFLR